MNNWHHERVWQEYVQQIFLKVGRVKSYTVTYLSKGLVAVVIPERQRLLLNPALIPIPEHPAYRLRFGTDRPFVPLLRAIVAHEGGHVAFSCRKPAGEVGWLWNALEDERMERWVTRRFPELERDFTFLGDVMLNNTLSKGTPVWDLKNACLMWRFCHDRPDVPFATTNPALWEHIRPLVEESWNALPGEVEDIAQTIWDLLPKSDQQQQPVQELGADGGGEQQGDQTSKAQSSGEKPEGQEETDESRPQAGAEPPQPPESEGEAQDGAPETDEGDDELPPAPGESPSEGADEGQGGESNKPHYDATLEAREQTVRDLADLLTPKQRPGKRVRSRSTGRYDFGRHMQGHERFFRKRGLPERPVPFFLRLVIDSSASMDGVKIRGAKNLADLLLRAAQLSRSKTEIWTFDTRARLLSTSQDPDAQHKIAHIGLGPSTNLGNALEEIMLDPPSKTVQEIVFILTDGQLTTNDRLRCSALMQSLGQGRLVVPLLLEGAGDHWDELFGQAFTLGPDELPDFLRDYLHDLRTVRQM